MERCDPQQVGNENGHVTLPRSNKNFRFGPNRLRYESCIVLAIRPSTSTEPATEDHNQAKRRHANVKKAAKAAKKKKTVKHLPKKTPSALGKEGQSRAGEGCREINPPLGATSDGLMQCVRSKGFRRPCRPRAACSKME